MINIKFKYDFKKDAYNWVRQIIFLPADSIDHIDIAVQEKVRQLYDKNPISHLDLLESTDHLTIDFVVDFLKNHQNIDVLESKKKELAKAWQKNEADFLKILSNILQKPIYLADYICYLSTVYNCPFYEKENWFMVSAFSNLDNQIYVIAHEFMHLQFIYWYKQHCLDKGLSQKNFWHIQEAITFILNKPALEHIITFKDKGYSVHQKLREKLKTAWHADNNFPTFLDKAIAIVNEEFNNN